MYFHCVHGCRDVSYFFLLCLVVFHKNKTVGLILVHLNQCYYFNINFIQISAPVSELCSINAKTASNKTKLTFSLLIIENFKCHPRLVCLAFYMRDAHFLTIQVYMLCCGFRFFCQLTKNILGGNGNCVVSGCVILPPQDLCVIHLNQYCISSVLCSGICSWRGRYTSRRPRMAILDDQSFLGRCLRSLFIKNFLSVTLKTDQDNSLWTVMSDSFRCIINSVRPKSPFPVKRKLHFTPFEQNWNY